MGEKLEDHLKSSDFDVENYPEATLSINSVKKTKREYGLHELFIKGITQTVEPCAIKHKQNKCYSSRRLTIDRTL